eukprot:GHVN01004819.1.p1 GENE.GHVN01004819.1~~GHVN01004819.1.p1  ORF type:complete len:332 (-),score=7.24 GHVN01004819.1:1108-2103(-)
MDAISVAPMMEYSDTYFRLFFRAMSVKTTLYTEMITAGRVIHMSSAALSAELGPDDNLTVVQVAGCCPETVSRAVQRICRVSKMRHFNINAGCPSTSAQKGGFGAVLLRNKETAYAVAKKTLEDNPGITLSVKTRIGLDGEDAGIEDFVECVSKSGVKRFVVHARKAVLSFRRTIKNCTAPPLEHEAVVALALRRKDLEIVLNGGIHTFEEAKAFIERGVFGVMLGRQAFSTPLMFLTADACFFGDEHVKAREDVLRAYLAALSRDAPGRGVYGHAIKPLVAMAHGLPHAKGFRAILYGGITRDESIEKVFEEAATFMKSRGIDIFSGGRG